MASINGVSGRSSAWAQSPVSGRQPPSRQQMFDKVDADGSGAVDAAELQSMLDHVGAGGDTDAKAALSAMDGNGDGSLDADELDAGVRDLMPAPSSTVAFAERKAPPADDDLFSKVDADGDGSVSEAELGALLQAMDEGTDASSTLASLDEDSDGRLSATEFSAGRPQGPGGPPPGGPRGARGADSTSSSSTTTDPLDTNADGTVSAQEKVAGELKALSTRLAELALELQTQYDTLSGKSTGATSGSSINVTA